MNKIIVGVASLAIFVAGPAFARGGSHRSSGHSSTVHVAGHTTKSGKYVPSHTRTAPDHSKYNNWSTKGNVNPYTGKAGTKDPSHR
ncbi:hypothetical protein [Dokdonella ginsengisoli]|uniref:Uncharacterized protein n=1 Tax=Dokdonella ginsengisoli TaxID=363846 RepID=A0ABV9R082_9GAMM